MQLTIQMISELDLHDTYQFLYFTGIALVTKEPFCLHETLKMVSTEKQAGMDVQNVYW